MRASCVRVHSQQQQQHLFFHDAAFFSLHSHFALGFQSCFFPLVPFLPFVWCLGVLHFASQQHTLLHKHKRPGITVSPGEDVASSRTWSRAGDVAEGVNGANRWDQCQKPQRFSSMEISPRYKHVSSSMFSAAILLYHDTNK